MATTSLIAEIIVIGSFSLVWIMLFTFKFLGLDITALSDWFLTYKDWSTAILVALIVICYQLGWIINLVSSFIAGQTFGKRIMLRLFKGIAVNDNEMEMIRATVQMKSSGYLQGRMREDLSVLRLSRSALINFFLIGVGFIMIGNLTGAFISLGIALISFLHAWYIYKRYYSRMLHAYQIIKEDNLDMEKETKPIRAKAERTRK